MFLFEKIMDGFVDFLFGKCGLACTCYGCRYQWYIRGCKIPDGQKEDGQPESKDGRPESYYSNRRRYHADKTRKLRPEKRYNYSGKRGF